MIGPEELRTELVGRGLIVLDVARDPRNGEVLVVYLHGNAGQADYAIETIRAVRGVLAVTESVQSRAIILVRVAP